MAKGSKFIKIVILILNLAAVSMLLASYSASYINPEKVWILAFFGLAYPVILFVNLLFVLLWLILWKRYIFLSLICILLGWNNLRAWYPFRFRAPESNPGVTIKVLSFNVHRLYGNDLAGKNGETRSQVTEFLSSQKADILFIQEFYAKGEDFATTLEKFTHSINIGYSFYMNYSGVQYKKKINAIAIFSKYPIINSGHFKLENGTMFGVYSDIVYKSDTIRLYNLHLESIRFGSEDYTFYSHLTEPDNEPEVVPLKEGSRRMVGKLRKAFILRSSQVRILKDHIDRCRYPVILGGDFNDTPSSYTYHMLSQSLDDSFMDAGTGFFESTYAGKFPAFRIDYILYSKQFKSARYQKFDIALSDHFPISSSLTFHPKKQPSWILN